MLPGLSGAKYPLNDDGNSVEPFKVAQGRARPTVHTLKCSGLIVENEATVDEMLAPAANHAQRFIVGAIQQNEIEGN